MLLKLDDNNYFLIQIASSMQQSPKAQEDNMTYIISPNSAEVSDNTDNNQLEKKKQQCEIQDNNHQHKRSTNKKESLKQKKLRKENEKSQRFENERTNNDSSNRNQQQQRGMRMDSQKESQTQDNYGLRFGKQDQNQSGRINSQQQGRSTIDFNKNQGPSASTSNHQRREQQYYQIPNWFPKEKVKTFANAIVASRWQNFLETSQVPPQQQRLMYYTSILLQISQKVKKLLNINETLDIQRLIMSKGGYQLNKKVYNFKRMRYGSHQIDSYRFLPTTTTVQIARLIKKKRIDHVTGISGSGKTSSFIFCIEVSDFKVKFMLTATYLVYKQWVLVYNFGVDGLDDEESCKKAAVIHKYFFVNFEIEKIIKSDFLNQCDKEIFNKEKLQKLTQYGNEVLYQKISEQYKDRNIRVRIVIDQFNTLASRIRQVIRIYEQIISGSSRDLNKRMSQLELETKRASKSNLIAEINSLVSLHWLLNRQFQGAITCSSITIESFLFKQYKKKIDPVINFSDCIEEYQPYVIQYLQYENSSWHLFQNMTWLWFQTQKNITQRLKQSKMKQGQQKTMIRLCQERFKKKIKANDETELCMDDFDWIAHSRPIDINFLFRKQSAIVNGELNKITFDAFLSYIKTELPKIKSKSMAAMIKKFSNQEYISAFYAHLDLLELTEKFIKMLQQTVQTQKNSFIIFFQLANKQNMKWIASILLIYYSDSHLGKIQYLSLFTYPNSAYLEYSCHYQFMIQRNSKNSYCFQNQEQYYFQICINQQQECNTYFQRHINNFQNNHKYTIIHNCEMGWDHHDKCYHFFKLASLLIPGIKFSILKLKQIRLEP